MQCSRAEKRSCLFALAGIYCVLFVCFRCLKPLRSSSHRRGDLYVAIFSSFLSPPFSGNIQVGPADSNLAAFLSLSLRIGALAARVNTRTHKHTHTHTHTHTHKHTHTHTPRIWKGSYSKSRRDCRLNTVRRILESKHLPRGNRQRRHRFGTRLIAALIAAARVVFDETLQR